MGCATAPAAGTVATATDDAPTAAAWLPGRIAGGDVYAEPGGAPSRALRKNMSHDCQLTHDKIYDLTLAQKCTVLVAVVIIQSCGHKTK